MLKHRSNNNTKGTQYDDNNNNHDNNSLLPSVVRTSNNNKGDDDSIIIMNWKRSIAVVFMIMTTILLVCTTRKTSSSLVLSLLKNGRNLPVVYSCTSSGAVNYKQPWQEKYEDNAQGKEKHQPYHENEKNNMTHFLQTYRHATYDAWPETYEEFKERAKRYKSKFIVPHVKSGDTIYESAGGIGLNLYMTLELIAEERPDIRDLTIYGNDYLEISSKRANHILDALFEQDAQQMRQKHHFQKGIYCPGDSMKLQSFVPANSFDIVYTGYISPMFDPLTFEHHLNTTLHIQQNYGMFKQLCRDQKRNPKDWKVNWMLHEMQDRQRDHFGTWMYEMIRITKPGGIIVTEHVAPSICVSMNDWGGVNKDYWKNTNETLQKYNWDIDPISIEMIDEVDPMYELRYHVFMRKNK